MNKIEMKNSGKLNKEQCSHGKNCVENMWDDSLVLSGCVCVQMKVPYVN